ncbi:MAG: hypothetical protein ABGZ53_29395 [Fuerstiella sp.]
MSELIALWLPILVSAVAIFFASFVSWVIIGHHIPDWAALPDQAENIRKLGELNLPTGRYVFPCVRTKEEMEDEGNKALVANGPWGTINLWGTATNMGRNLGLTFFFYFVTAVFIAYLGTLALEPGAGFSKVFQVTGTAAILAHCFAFIPNNIWFGAPRRAIRMDVLDGIVYSIITGVIFGAMWP